MRRIQLSTARVLAVVTLLWGLPLVAQSQWGPRPDDPTCANALAAVASVTPAVAHDSLGSLYARLSGCRPEYGRAVALAMRNLQSSTDTQLVVTAISPAPIIDSAIFSAARDLAANPNASGLVRFFSLHVLYQYVERNGFPSPDSFAAQRRGAHGCATAISTDSPSSIFVGEFSPLPASAASDARAVAMSIQKDPASTPELLSASYCVLEAWRAKAAIPSNPHWLFSTNDISVEYVCGNRYRLRNAHPVELNLQWEVAPLPIRLVSLAPKPSQEAYSERLLDVGLNGDLKIYLDGDLIFTRPNLATPCP
jgi:hypothetical protein